MVVKRTENYYTAAWVNVQIIEGSQWRLYMLAKQILYKPLSLKCEETKAEMVVINGESYLKVKHGKIDVVEGQRPAVAAGTVKIICVNVDEVVAVGIDKKINGSV